jgi:ribosomal protein L24E
MKCSRCSSEIKKGEGTMYVHNTGIVKYYCSSRCYKNDVLVGRSFNKKEARRKPDKR